MGADMSDDVCIEPYIYRIIRLFYISTTEVFKMYVFTSFLYKSVCDGAYSREVQLGSRSLLDPVFLLFREYLRSVSSWEGCVSSMGREGMFHGSPENHIY